MCKFLKTVNNIFRVLFIGVFVLTAIAKVFDIKPSQKAVENEEDYITSEFDEIW